MTARLVGETAEVSDDYGKMKCQALRDRPNAFFGECFGRLGALGFHGGCRNTRNPKPENPKPPEPSTPLLKPYMLRHAKPLPSEEAF